MRKFAVIWVFAFGLAGLAPTATAVADEDMSIAERVENLSAEGAEHFAEGEYEQAIEKFEKAYDLEPVPNLLFNIGRVYEQMEDWEEAEHYYEEFVRAPDVDEDARDQAMDKVRSMRERREAEQQEEEEEEKLAEEDEEPDEDVDEIEDVEEPSLLPGGLAVGAGTVMIGAGALTGLRARSNADRIDDAELGYEERSDAQSRARTQGVVADVLFVGGAATIVTGSWVLVSALGADGTDGQASADAPSYMATPWVDDQSAGIGLTLDF